MSIRIISPKSWHSIFRVLRDHPEAYLGKNSIMSLCNYVDGIMMAALMYDIPREDRFNDFSWDAFEEWVRTKKKTSLRSFFAAQDMITVGDGWPLWFFWYDQYNESEGKEDFQRWKENNEQQELYRYTEPDYDDPALY